MCLVNVPKCEGEWPQIGKMLEISPSEACIQWYKGSKTGSWSPCTVPVPKERGKRMPRVERIPRDQIWFSGFSFTPSRNFPSSVRTLTTMSSNSGSVNAHLTSCPDANKIN